MRLSILIILLIIQCSVSFAQRTINGVILDDSTGNPLPFATVKAANISLGTVSDMDGRFSISLPKSVKELVISYTGYETITVPATGEQTIYLQKAVNVMKDVVIQPPYNKIRRIINTAIDNKRRHNPEKYDAYQCYVYYKMKADMIPNEQLIEDDTTIEKLRKFIDNQDILFGETYSKRSYYGAGRLQETILASRLSGFNKTYFTNLVTDILPFHVYNDDIQLSGVRYIHPIAKGWQSRYEFDLADEILDGRDTVFIFNYYPKKHIHFNSLRGSVFINSNGYAISHITARSTDTSNERYMKMEQYYKYIDGKWFPAELNYDLIFKKYPSKKIGLRLSGHSVVDSVSFTADADKFDKIHPIKLHDSVDDRTKQEWQQIRKQPLTPKESNTYVFMDSISEEVGLDKIMETLTVVAATGKVPVKFIDIDITRLIAFNAYERYRLGLGLYTNDKVSKYFSIGGWLGYGTHDKAWKYGGSLDIYPTGNKEYGLTFSYENTYQNTGNVSIHRELDNTYYRNLLLNKVDRLEEYKVSAHGRTGYLSGEVYYKQGNLQPQYSYTFDAPGIVSNQFNTEEGGVKLRYAYRERRAPILSQYYPLPTKYPILYINAGYGRINSYGYGTIYQKVVAAVTYNVHVNRWGTDRFRGEAGILNTSDNKPLPRSMLLASNGYKRSKFYQLYIYGGIMTMYPFAYFSDRYASLLYRHDFDRILYKLKFSSPYISIAHNMIYGSLNSVNASTNKLSSIPATGYHETGLILNRLLRINYVNIAYFDLNFGGFYHWNNTFDLQKNGTLVIGASLSF